MLKFIVALLIGLSILPKTTQWGQCDGIGYTGSKDCCAPCVCQYSNPWYSQCLTGSTQSTAISSSSSSSVNQGCSALWEQCGGIGWTGPTCCYQSTCVVSNPYYSQCLQSGASSSSSSTSSRTSSKTTPSTNDNRQLGVTTRYWDCCKPSCAWPGKASVTSPVKTCAQNGITSVDANTQSGCNGGTAYMCNNQQPFSISSTLSYGYAAAHIAGQTEANWCCACYSLIFTSGPVIGKELIVLVTNTGGDLGNNHFDLQMPGGGVGLFNGCSSQFPGPYSWGQTYGGVSQRSDCANLPVVIQAGCYWRFDWFMNADNPTMSFKQVSCPSVLTANTQCIRV
ncbi:unnamed protein product [Rotaria sp. Silwood2]|nr:unnamed protein product [Rotaria sp. Silwood2]CAF2719640.1 unnamed protein product [Rotaria sp. Silwood2]CAF3440914.1 unnamed protein product [Rotaria sp. Silwood2]CAF4047370.1 unnamed protein product [Rotaria sp. Silwood2]CAF4379140.1 unnamed protein product [Rotaria sp. Silwood2]